jgi:hypothetical protein
LASVCGQDFDGYTDWLITQDNPYDGNYVYGNVQLAYEKMKRVALAEQYDAVWIVEADTIPPADALSKLVETLDAGADVVSGLYVLRHGANAPNLFRAERSPELGSGLSWAELAPVWGQTIRVSGGCMGCVLARPEALDFNFEMGFTDGPRMRAPDMAWMRHNWSAGRVTLARLDVRCGHKDVDGTILMPAQQGAERQNA